MKENISVSKITEKVLGFIIAAFVMIYNVGRVIVHLASKTRNKDKAKNLVIYSGMFIIFGLIFKSVLTMNPAIMLAVGSVSVVIMIVLAIFVTSEIVGY